MPEAVSAFSQTKSYQEYEQIQQAMLAAYKDDFNKYASGSSSRGWRRYSLVLQQWWVVMYSHVDREERSRDLSSALCLLQLARVVHKVPHTRGNGVPWGAEADYCAFEVPFMDVGLLLPQLWVEDDESRAERPTHADQQRCGM
jgi:hypothetical protein